MALAKKKPTASLAKSFLSHSRQHKKLNLSCANSKNYRMSKSVSWQEQRARISASTKKTVNSMYEVKSSRSFCAKTLKNPLLVQSTWTRLRETEFNSYDIWKITIFKIILALIPYDVLNGHYVFKLLKLYLK